MSDMTECKNCGKQLKQTFCEKCVTDELGPALQKLKAEPLFSLKELEKIQWLERRISPAWASKEFVVKLSTEIDRLKALAAEEEKKRKAEEAERLKAEKMAYARELARRIIEMPNSCSFCKHDRLESCFSDDCVEATAETILEKLEVINERI